MAELPQLAEMVGLRETRLIEQFDAYKDTQSAADAPKLEPMGANYFARK